MYRFAFRGRWLAGALAVLVVAAVCVRLGIWQLDRHTERRAFNAAVAEQSQLPPVPIDDLVSPGDGRDADAEFRRVEVSGRFDAEREFLVMARSLHGRPGQYVVTPLVTESGAAVLVNRGFVPVVDAQVPLPRDAKPPEGVVTVVGAFRASEDGARFVAAQPAVEAGGTLGQVTRIDAARLGELLPYPLYPGYVRVEAERPEPEQIPIALPPPEPGSGPHLSYAVQWFSFAVVFLVGWVVLVRRFAQRSRPRPQAVGEERWTDTVTVG